MDRISQLTKLPEPRFKRRRRWVGGELGECGVEGDEQLESGLASAPLIKVKPSPEGELLPGQRVLAPTEQGSQAGLRGEDAASALAPGARDDLTGVGPQPLGHLLAATVAEAGDEQLVTPYRALVGVGGGDAQGVERPVEDPKAGMQLSLASSGQPGGCLTLVSERGTGLDNRGPTRRHRRGIRLGLDLRSTCSPRQKRSSLAGAERGDDQHV